MKIKVIIPTIALFMLLSIAGKAQFTFSVGTGLQHNSGTFGYKFKKFVPQLSLQVIRGSSTFTESGKRNDPNTGAIVDFDDEFKFTGSLIIPSLGLKYFFMEQDKLKAYGNLNVTKVILSAKIEDSTDPTVNADLQDVIKNTNIFGGQLGFGTEYFFDQHFSVGGEFGFMLFNMSNKRSFIDTVDDPNTGQPINVTIKETLKVSASPTYGKMSLNFYFGK